MNWFRFFKEVQGESKRITYPTWDETKKLTMVTIAICVFFSVFLGAVTWALDIIIFKLLGA